jgi:competence protein ComEC
VNGPARGEGEAHAIAGAEVRAGEEGEGRDRGLIAELHPNHGDIAVVVVVAALALGSRYSSHLVSIAFVCAAAFAVVIRRVKADRSQMVRLAAPVLMIASLGATIGMVLADRSERGMTVSQFGMVKATSVDVVRDPEKEAFGWSLDVRWNGKRFATRIGSKVPGLSLATEASVGDRLLVDISFSTLSGGPTGWRKARHYAGAAQIHSVAAHRPATGIYGIANAARDRLQRGFRGLPADLRPLAGGFVTGDDRGQRPEVTDDFRATGLGHLLVVSGQNVAFVLAAARPLIERARIRWRVLAVIGVLILFGTMTRWEPSVLRAVAMAGIAAGVRSGGRPQPAIRVIGLGVGVLLLIDPMLVHSLGFALSIAATTGLVVLSRPIEIWLTERAVFRWIRAPLAATLSAQVFTCWLILPISGSIPLASIPANLLALPAAAPAMILGLTTGFVAGYLPVWAATILLIPLRFALTWVAGVARVLGGVPLGRLGAAALAIVFAAIVAAVLFARWHARGSQTLVKIVVSVALVTVATGPVAALRPPARLGTVLEGGGTLWRGPPRGLQPGPTVVVIGSRPDTEKLFGSLRRHGVGRVDAVVLAKPTRTAQSVISPLASRFEVRAVIAPTMLVAPGHGTVTGVRLGPSDRVVVGDLSVWWSQPGIASVTITDERSA